MLHYQLPSRHITERVYTLLSRCDSQLAVRIAVLAWYAIQSDPGISPSPPSLPANERVLPSVPPVITLDSQPDWSTVRH
jgi:hypothetical protein